MLSSIDWSAKRIAKTGDRCTWIFSAQISNPNNAWITFKWSFQDGTMATTSLPQVEHTYTLGSITTGMTTVTLKSPGCADQSLTATVTHNCFPCPPGQHRDSSGNCVDECPKNQHRDANGNCVPDTSPPPNGGFSVCCFLILLWGILHLAGGSLLYFGLWIPAIIVSAVATIVSRYLDRCMLLAVRSNLLEVLYAAQVGPHDQRCTCYLPFRALCARGVWYSLGDPCFRIS